MKNKTKTLFIVLIVVAAVGSLSYYIYLGYKAAQRRNAAIRKWLNLGSYINEAGELEDVPASLEKQETMVKNSEKVSGGQSIKEYINGHIWWYQTQNFKNPFTKLFVIKNKLDDAAASTEEEDNNE
jgi:hypothetical protein